MGKPNTWTGIFAKTLSYH